MQLKPSELAEGVEYYMFAVFMGPMGKYISVDLKPTPFMWDSQAGGIRLYNNISKVSKKLSKAEPVIYDNYDECLTAYEQEIVKCAEITLQHLLKYKGEYSEAVRKQMYENVIKHVAYVREH